MKNSTYSKPSPINLHIEKKCICWSNHAILACFYKSMTHSRLIHITSAVLYKVSNWASLQCQKTITYGADYVMEMPKCISLHIMHYHAHGKSYMISEDTIVQGTTQNKSLLIVFPCNHYEKKAKLLPLVIILLQWICMYRHILQMAMLIICCVTFLINSH